MNVAVAFSPADGVALELALELPASSTAIDAIRASGLVERFPEMELGACALGVWGRACPPHTRLREGDRVEIYRPLTMDPNEARRLRAKQLRQKKRA